MSEFNEPFHNLGHTPFVVRSDERAVKTQVPAVEKDDGNLTIEKPREQIHIALAGTRIDDERVDIGIQQGFEVFALEGGEILGGIDGYKAVIEQTDRLRRAGIGRFAAGDDERNDFCCAAVLGFAVEIRSGLLDAIDEVAALEKFHGAPNGGAADIVLRHEFVLSGEPVSRLYFSGLNPVNYIVVNGFI